MIQHAQAANAGLLKNFPKKNLKEETIHSQSINSEDKLDSLLDQLLEGHDREQ